MRKHLSLTGNNLYIAIQAESEAQLKRTMQKQAILIVKRQTLYA